MAPKSVDIPVTLVEGTLKAVDIIGREVLVQINGNGTTMSFDVPPDCAVFLNRERVKLRLLQPTDWACVAYRDQDGRHRARVIEV